MKNTKVKKITVFLVSGILMVSIIVFTFDIITRALGIKSKYEKIDNFLVVRHNTAFNLVQDPFIRPEKCTVPCWGCCNSTDISYDKKYIQEIESRYDGEKCYDTKTYKFKVLKRGYTEIVTSNNCASYRTKYRILIY